MTSPVGGTGVAVVTGGASGIGLALARRVGAKGVEVVVADRDKAALERAVADLVASEVTAIGHCVDIRDEGAVEALAATAAARGPIRFAGFNAGVSSAGARVWEAPAEQTDFVLDVNLRGLFHCIRAFVPRLIEQAEPSDVSITASIAGLVTAPTAAAYAASKAAVIAVGKSLRDDLAAVRPDIKVALLCAGTVKTNLQNTSAAAQPAGVGSMTPEEVAQYHRALNELGVEPAVVADSVFEALDAGRFWVLPPPDDPWCQWLVSELTTLLDAASG